MDFIHWIKKPHEGYLLMKKCKDPKNHRTYKQFSP